MKRFIKSALKQLGYHLAYEQSSEGLDWMADIAKIVEAHSVTQCIDVGAYLCEISQRLLQKFPNASVVAFEPSPTTFDQALRLFPSSPRLKIIRAAIGRENAKVYFPRNDPVEWPKRKDCGWHPSQLTSLHEAKSESALDLDGYAETEVFSIDDFCERAGITEIAILKSDTNGFDLDVISGAKRLLQNGQIRFVLVEVGFSPDDSSHSFFCPITQSLSDFGFALFQIYNMSGLWHFKNFGYTYADALFVRR